MSGLVEGLERSYFPLETLKGHPMAGQGYLTLTTECYQFWKKSPKNRSSMTQPEQTPNPVYLVYPVSEVACLASFDA
jgi:hypothetical protein